MKPLVLLLALAALAVPSAALGKGPSEATLDGPQGAITFSGAEGSGPLGNLTQQSGWFTAAFDQEPNALLTDQPRGDLGPKYTVTYTVPQDASRTVTIRQDIYPYASDGPVTYMAPGQPIFDMQTRGGWFQAGPDLKETLVAAGLPETAAVSSSLGAVSSSDGTSFPTMTVSLLGFAIVFVTATALLVRRRARSAAA